MITLKDRKDKMVVNFDLLADNNDLVKYQIKMVQIRIEKEADKNWN